MPLTEKGSKIKSNMQQEYGPERGEKIFYASKNKGTISGVDALSQADIDKRMKQLHAAYKAGQITEQEFHAHADALRKLMIGDEDIEEGKGLTLKTVPAKAAADAKPFSFACDNIPDCTARIVKSFGSHVLLAGMAQDEGAWFTRGPEGFRRHLLQQEALAHIEYAQDYEGHTARHYYTRGAMDAENEEGTKGTGKERPTSQLLEDVQQVHGGKIVESGGKFKATDTAGVSTTHDTRRDAVEALAKRAKRVQDAALPHGGQPDMGSYSKGHEQLKVLMRRGQITPEQYELRLAKLKAEAASEGKDAELFVGGGKTNNVVAKPRVA